MLLLNSVIDDVIPANSVMTRSFYNIKKVVKGLQLPHKKIDACPEGCMLFWKDDALLDKCKKYGRVRYKTCDGNIVLNGKKGNTEEVEKIKKPIPQSSLTYFPLTPRLQRMFATKDIAEQMRWHKENPPTP